MVCVVITRNGEGDVWLYASVREARLHPIPQIDDVYAETPEALVEQYGRDGVRSLLRFAEGRDRATMVDAIEGWRNGRRTESLSAAGRQLLWEKVRQAGGKPPQDPSEIVRTIIEDREAREGRVLRSIPDAARSSVLTSGATKRSETPLHQEKENDMGEKREVFRMKDADTIDFGKDADGKQYSTEHTPKRGENTKSLWGKYRSGMTVKEALDAGLSRSNIRRDRRAGNIVITPSPEAEATTEAEAEEAA